MWTDTATNNRAGADRKRNRTFPHQGDKTLPWYLDQLGSRSSVDIRWDEDQQLPDNFNRHDFVPAPGQPPIRMHLMRDRKGLPDYFTGPTTSHLVVSAAFRALVERFEPGVHHFIAAPISQPDGMVHTEHFIFKNGGFVEGGIVVEESEVAVRIRNGPRGERSIYLSKSLEPRLMWAASKVQGRHLWGDPKLNYANIVSDALYAEIKAARMKDFLAIESRINPDR